LFLIFLLSFSLVSSDTPPSFIELTLHNFDSTVRTSPNTFVLFFAPWCAKCSTFIEEEYNTIVSSFDSTQYTFGKVNIEEEQYLASLHSVNTFPSIKLYRQHTTGEGYDGEFKADKIIYWLKRKTVSPSQLLSTQTEIDDFFNQRGTKILAKVKEGGKAMRHWLRATAAPQLDEYYIGHILIETDPEGITLYKPNEDPIIFTDTILKTKILKWVDEVGPNLCAVLTEPIWTKSQADSIPLLIIMVNSLDDTEVIDIARQIALKYKNQVRTTYSTIMDMAENLGASGQVTPTALIIQWPSTITVFNEELEQFHLETGMNFVNQTLEGKYESFKKSEPIPETNDEPVKVIVRKSFDQMVKDPTKNVFVEFYAPRCAYCATFEPIWKELAGLYKNDNVMIAKFNADANFPPSELNVQKFPTLIFFPTYNKDGIRYEGERNLLALKEFIQTNTQSSKQEL